MTGFPPGSFNRRVIVSGPTWSGRGPISHSIATVDFDSLGFPHPGASAAATHAKISRILPPLNSRTFNPEPCRSRRLVSSSSRSQRSAGSFESRRAGLCQPLVPGTRACIVVVFLIGRKHMVVHCDDHGDKHDRVVEKMQLNAREEEL